MNTIHHLHGVDYRDDRRRRRRASRRLPRLLAAGVVGVALLAACGGDDDDDGTSATSAAPAEATTATTAASTGGGLYGDGTTSAPATTAGDAATTAPAATGAASVAIGETSLGEVLVDANGMTLYAFTPDTEGEPTCLDDCAAAWPPAIVEGEPVIGEGLDASVFTTVENPDGTQLKAGDRPLYTFANDSAPGDVNGQGVGDVWFAVAPDGSLIE